MTLVLRQLCRCFPSTKQSLCEKFLPYLNSSMEEYEINTIPRVSAFLAQVGHESGGFNYVEEIASGVAYEYRKDLGNLEQKALDIAHSNYSTTGKWFKGHGLIQITGYYNHKKCSEALEIDCVRAPKLLCDPEWATKSAAWFWKTHKCNELADRNDMYNITKVINGGLNGYHSRVALYNHIKVILTE